jgi:hypothetical protein
MADMIQNYRVSLEEQGEFLATQWLSVKQFEEAGEP